LVLPLLSGHLKQQIPLLDLSDDSQDMRQGKGVKKDCASTVIKGMSQGIVVPNPIIYDGRCAAE
jgi:hypothetical protein